MDFLTPKFLAFFAIAAVVVGLTFIPLHWFTKSPRCSRCQAASKAMRKRDGEWACWECVP